jgi:hypothetical protein
MYLKFYAIFYFVGDRLGTHVISAIGIGILWNFLSSLNSLKFGQRMREETSRLAVLRQVDLAPEMFKNVPMTPRDLGSPLSLLDRTS